jgi:hypothetical protein
VLRRDQPVYHSKALYALASNSVDWDRYVERLLLQALIQDPADYQEERRKVQAAIEEIGRLKPREGSVHVFFTQAELKRLEENASFDGTSVPDFIRILTLAILDEMPGRSCLPILNEVPGRGSQPGLVYPLNRLTSTAQQAVIEAQGLATSEGRGHIETGDMLLGLLRKAKGAAFRVLEDVGIGEDRVRSALVQVARTEDFIEEGIGTTRTSSVQLVAVVEAALHGVQYPEQVGTWQLIIALTSHDGRARDALVELGVSETMLRAKAGHIGTGDESA